MLKAGFITITPAIERIDLMENTPCSCHPAIYLSF
jgi:hypothetical protein